MSVSGPIRTDSNSMWQGTDAAPTSRISVAVCLCLAALSLTACGDQASAPTVSVRNAGKYVILVGEKLPPPSGDVAGEGLAGKLGVVEGRCLAFTHGAGRPEMIMWPAGAELQVEAGMPVVHVGSREFRPGQWVVGDNEPLDADTVAELPEAENLPAKCRNARVVRISRPKVPPPNG